VTAFTVVSQFANIVVLKVWGGISDRFSNKSVLNVAAPAFIACIVGMVIASQINERAILATYLIVLHVFMGMAAAGVSLATSNIAMKLAPRGGGTAYIAANALIASFAAGLAPIIGGLSADFFAARELSFHVLWRDPGGFSQFLRLEISHWDFYFLISGAWGLYACHRLAQIAEAGTIGKRAVVGQLLGEARRVVHGVAPVESLRLSFPGASLIEQHARLRIQKRAARARARREAAQGA
jgi:MFS family permease